MRVLGCQRNVHLKIVNVGVNVNIPQVTFAQRYVCVLQILGLSPAVPTASSGMVCRAVTSMFIVGIPSCRGAVRHGRAAMHGWWGAGEEAD